jgi:hypothetical protein
MDNMGRQMACVPNAGHFLIMLYNAFKDVPLEKTSPDVRNALCIAINLIGERRSEQ